jgi:hypothetical protein
MCRELFIAYLIAKHADKKYYFKYIGGLLKVKINHSQTPSEPLIFVLDIQSFLVYNIH